MLISRLHVLRIMAIFDPEYMSIWISLRQSDHPSVLDFNFVLSLKRQIPYDCLSGWRPALGLNVCSPRGFMADDTAYFAQRHSILVVAAQLEC